MALQNSRLYEAMFLVETNIASDSEATKGMIQTIMDRAHAELLVCRLWDERRLAYDIDKHKRAAYVLCYFRANGTAVSSMERDVQLSEHLLRVLVLRADHISPEELERIKGLSESDRHTPPPAGPAAGPPIQQQPTEDAPTEDTPTEDAPTEDTPTEDAPTEDTPTEDAPTEDIPADDAPTVDASTEDASVPQSEKDPTEPT